jgi:hypothetical protein
MGFDVVLNGSGLPGFPVPRAWAKVSIILAPNYARTSSENAGVHMGCLHSNRGCSFLKRRRDMAEQNYKIVEVEGELLHLLRWCRHCTPATKGREGSVTLEGLPLISTSGSDMTPQINSVMPCNVGAAASQSSQKQGGVQ